VCALAAVPVAVLVDLLRARLARSAVGDLVVALRRDPAPGAVRDAMARALGDPSLQVAFWLPDHGGYADAGGRPVDLGDDPERVTTMVDLNGERVASELVGGHQRVRALVRVDADHDLRFVFHPTSRCPLRSTRRSSGREDLPQSRD